jgi:hypothetical protein
LPDPFVLIFALGFLLLLALAWLRRGGTRIVAINLAFVALAFSLFEGYLQVSDSIAARRAALSPTAHAVAEGAGTSRAGSYLDRFLADDPALGYRILPAERRLESVLKRADGSVIYDVTYSLDGNGMRVTPEGAPPTIYFLGDSFTFGEGVDDGETLPASYERLTGQRAINLGVPGYGPHQVLRLIELHRPAALGLASPDVAVLTLLTGHVERVAGRSPWDTHGPHYEAVAGRAVYQGPYMPFTPAAAPPPSRLEHLLASWRTYQRLAAAWRQRAAEASHAADRDRLLAVVLETRRQLRERDHVEMITVLWDTIPSNSAADAAWLAERLKASGIPLLQVSRDLPELAEPRFYIDGDGHPQGTAYAKVAAALAPLISAAAAKGKD